MTTLLFTHSDAGVEYCLYRLEDAGTACASREQHAARSYHHSFTGRSTAEHFSSTTSPTTYQLQHHTAPISLVCLPTPSLPLLPLDGTTRRSFHHYLPDATYRRSQFVPFYFWNWFAGPPLPPRLYTVHCYTPVPAYHIRCERHSSTLPTVMPYHSPTYHNLPTVGQFTSILFITTQPVEPLH